MGKLDQLTYSHGKDKNLYVIWLHGLGATYHDFYQVVPMLGLSSQLGIEFIFPQAPTQPVTINNGISMPAWYDFESFSLDQKEDREGIEESSSKIMEIVNSLPTGKVILCGFSQGGAIALHAGLTNKNINAVIALSSYLPLMSIPGYWDANKVHSLPILLCHGNIDPVVPVQLGKMTESFLSDDYVSYKEFPMAHEFIQQEALAVGEFITKCYHDH